MSKIQAYIIGYNNGDNVVTLSNANADQYCDEASIRPVELLLDEGFNADVENDCIVYEHRNYYFCSSANDEVYVQSAGFKPIKLKVE